MENIELIEIKSSQIKNIPKAVSLIDKFDFS
jgi:hypothetical protein